jgi:signal transduction histidine kinase
MARSGAAARFIRSIDWRTVFMLPPSRRFTPAELARALPEPMSPSVKISVLLNMALPAVALVVAFGRQGPWPVPAAMLAFLLLLAWLGLRAWADPSAPLARHGCWLLPLAAGAVAGWLLASRSVPRQATAALAIEIVIGSFGLWFAVVHRHQYVQMRLAELDERERAVEMARRLAAAQLEPHFLFNTLASLQHWVSTRDERAAPLLEALTGYLRATLPMFARPTLPLADEAEAVRRYLRVMQARLGARLAWRIDIDPALADLPLPPGLVLTLVENAVEHGIEPQLAGGELALEARREGDEAVLVVHDNGPGPPDDAREGLGLANSRQRLALTHGEGARLVIGRGPAGGCRAELRVKHGLAPQETTA